MLSLDEPRERTADITNSATASGVTSSTNDVDSSESGQVKHVEASADVVAVILSNSGNDSVKKASTSDVPRSENGHSKVGTC